MKKLAIIFITLIFLSGCATVNDYPFAPDYKYGKHKTKKCKPIKKHNYWKVARIDCTKNW